MKKGLTEIVLVVDKSGSMSGVVSDTIGGLNTFITEQKKLPGTAKFTLVFFDTMIIKKFFRVDLNSVNKISVTDYVACGNTALIDAACDTIDSVGLELRALSEEERPEKVIFAILTDGEENSSVRFKKEQLAARIKNQTNVYNWEFLFLGAGFDAFTAGANYNISYANTRSYTSNIELATQGMEYLNTAYTVSRTTTTDQNT